MVENQDLATSDAPTRLPQYVERIRRALKAFTRSPKVKAQLAELFARQVEAPTTAFHAGCSRKAPLQPIASFRGAERIGLLAIALNAEEQRRVVDLIESLLAGTPADGRSDRWPATC